MTVATVPTVETVATVETSRFRVIEGATSTTNVEQPNRWSETGPEKARSVTAVPGSERYTPISENPFFYSTQVPLSTFSIDVDTASYANVRRFLNTGSRPPADAVRLEN